MIRVIKLGGSLFTWKEYPAVLRVWLSQQSAATNVVIPGGGPFAEAIRQADRDFSLGDERSHWLAIDAVSLAARLVAATLAESEIIDDFSIVRSRIAEARDGTFIFDPRAFLAHHERHVPGTTLPHDWTVTSDSIAARLAEVVVADELVLLKSADAPAESLIELARLGYIDSHFPIAAARLGRVRFVNLRSFPAQFSVIEHSDRQM